MKITALIAVFVLIIILLIIIILSYSLSHETNKVDGGYREVYIDAITPTTKDVPYLDDAYDEQHIYAVRASFYKDIRSDKQISTIVRYGSVGEYARLIQLLGKHIGGHDRRRVLDKLLNKHSDSAVYEELKHHFNRDEDARSLYQARDAFRPLKYYLEKHNIQVRNYLDVGCGNGKITAHMKTLLGVECAHCVEVDSSLHNDNVRYLILDKPDESIKLSYTDGQFDVITAYMSLHHVKRLDDMINELARVLSDDGILFIKEHDCWNAFDAMLIDIEHAIFMYGHESFDNYFINYKNYWGWDKVVSNHFKYVQADYYYPALRNEISPTRAFWSIYRKKERT